MNLFQKNKNLFDKINDFIIKEKCDQKHIEECYRILESNFEITIHNREIFLSALVFVGYSLKSILKFVGESYGISPEFMKEK